MHTKKIIPLLLICLLFACANKGATDKKAETEAIKTKNEGQALNFNADSAYTYVANQAAFGPRVPNTDAHKACGDYLIDELKRFGAQLFVQDAILTAYDGTKLEARNIIGSYNPEQKKRILLFAHWDSRPYADEDPDPANHYKHIDGVDDGASGVGVLLEIARQISFNDPAVGIDIIFFDAEDYGEPSFSKTNKEHTWCLGSQFWAKKPHVPNYRADYGILLDMVGSKHATFFKEGYSMYTAAPIVEKIWNKARDLGYGKFFINAAGSTITDDHLYVNRGRNIPCVDIIYTSDGQDPHAPNHGFGPHWHTVGDTMDNIDKATLKAVGQTVLEIIYNK
ncbi:M28 family peptidase [Parabacteroides sp. OttesenSCG-928-K15]|nr:M28 family peptidase [Parabacteroides sp. OttesenSCG-928-K15]